MALANLHFLCRCCQRCQNSQHLAFSSTIYGWSSVRNISHYEVLGIKQNATSKEIKQAFFKKSKQLHPDSDPANPELHSQFVKLNEAYNVLSKERSRRDYDAQQTLRKAWPGPEAQRPSARDPFDPLHVHRQQRSGQQAWEGQGPRRHSAEDFFHSDHFRAAGRNPDPSEDDAYWQEFHKTPPEWYSDQEFRRRQQRNLRTVIYCLLIMSGSLLVHFVSYRQIAKLHTGLMNERDHMISQALIKAKEQGRARHKERLQQKRTPVLQEDPTKPQDSVNDPVPSSSTAK
ncbi:dnaJ homolog subfamily C member 4 isoform X1 [Crotalus tigris]|uniref:dnaJ homolog subfamily C member 4 isoform X1 n=1 Tax=Crotalus tigris TaxID=88082 RepID=UPI00192F4EA1|nr:dnaJ homolog subfamily C member 4 isoform X1 [Crotalus tigris]XP_039219367.1 dnaJ homolog subfamily C member 4 isoform X1 [Crotalus tigris]